MTFRKYVPVVIDNTDPPAVTVKLGALPTLPPVEPKLIVAVFAWLRVKPPVPVTVRLVAVAALSTVVLAVVSIRAILPEPNEIARTVLLLERKLPVVKVKLARLRVPPCKLKVLVLRVVMLSASVTVMPVTDIVVLPSVFPELVIVPEP
jgi:hypothetical protein